MKSEIKGGLGRMEPCPFCGMRDMKMVTFEQAKATWQAVECQHCSARGPFWGSESGAEVQWNERYKPEIAHAVSERLENEGAE